MFYEKDPSGVSVPVPDKWDAFRFGEFGIKPHKRDPKYHEHIVHWFRWEDPEDRLQMSAAYKRLRRGMQGLTLMHSHGGRPGDKTITYGSVYWPKHTILVIREKQLPQGNA